MNENWISLIGNFEQLDEKIKFIGNEIDYPDGKKGPSVGNLLYSTQFSNGTIEAAVNFDSFEDTSGAEIIFSYNIQTKAFLSAGITGTKFQPYSIRGFDGAKWLVLSEAGEKTTIKSGKDYKIKINVLGSTVKLFINDVLVCQQTIPYPLKNSQVGLWALGAKNIEFSKVNISTEKPKAFIVMQFSNDYTEVYKEVIQKICEENKIKPERADEMITNGLIINDITQSIREAFIIIAEITEQNPNVFYEVGYAHALNKPTILLAKKGSKLPFDVSPFRVLFYEDSISGKGKFEEALRKHISAII